MNFAFNKNKEIHKESLSELNNYWKAVKKGGGIKNIEKQHKKGKLTARERIDYLIDANSDWLEIAAFAGDKMYQKVGGCPSGGVVTGIGYVANVQCVIVANDATVKAGAWFPITAKKNLRAQEVSIENKLPIIYLVDSAGVFLPLQEEVFPDKEHFGRQFRNSAIMSSMGIIQIAAIMGGCVAGGAYLPIMSDESLIVDKTGLIFLAGSYLVKSAIGEIVDNETLGGATTQSEISGVTDNKFPNDKAALEYIKNIFSKIGDRPKAGFNRSKPEKPTMDPREIYGFLPYERTNSYEMKDIISRLIDSSQFSEYKSHYGKTLVCGTARIDGWAIGIVANQRKIVKTKKGEVQMGGVIYSDSADKAARFIMNCNQRKIPLVFLQDVSGFIVGSRAEHSGIIKDGAKMISAMANSVVPKFTIIIGNSYGAGNYAMCGKAYDPRLIYSWPSAKMAVMSGSIAANTLLKIKIAAAQSKGKKLTEEEKKEYLEEITNRYNEQLSPYYAAARLWVDGVIDPLETRKVISMGIEAANNAPIEKSFNLGIIQT